MQCGGVCPGTGGAALGYSLGLLAVRLAGGVEQLLGLHAVEELALVRAAVADLGETVQLADVVAEVLHALRGRISAIFLNIFMALVAHVVAARVPRVLVEAALVPGELLLVKCLHASCSPVLRRQLLLLLAQRRARVGPVRDAALSDRLLRANHLVQFVRGAFELKAVVAHLLRQQGPASRRGGTWRGEDLAAASSAASSLVAGSHRLWLLLHHGLVGRLLCRVDVAGVEVCVAHGVKLRGVHRGLRWLVDRRARVGLRPAVRLGKPLCFRLRLRDRVKVHVAVFRVLALPLGNLKEVLLQALDCRWV